MDAIRYLKEKKRICDMYTCSLCPLTQGDTVACDALERNAPEMASKIVEEWVNENPIITNGAKFKEVFGWSPFSVGGFDIRKGWWDEPYKGAV